MHSPARKQYVVPRTKPEQHAKAWADEQAASKDVKFVNFNRAGGNHA